MPQKPIVSLDFDGVLYSYINGYNEGVLIDPPVEGAQEFCQWLHKSGFDIVVSTCRLHLEDPDVRLEHGRRIRDWFVLHEFPAFMYSDIRREPGGRPRVVLTSRKPIAHVYVDDRGFRFEGSFDTVKRLLQLPGNYAPWHKKDQTNEPA